MDPHLVPPARLVGRDNARELTFVVIAIKTNARINRVLAINLSVYTSGADERDAEQTD
jgi:hypothetical protein